jgi:large repetitive protein
LTFVPTSGYIGLVQFPYTISDNNGGTATANESILIPNPITTCSNMISNGDFATGLSNWTAMAGWIFNNSTAALATDALTNQTISQVVPYTNNNGNVLFKFELQPAEANNLTTFGASMDISFGGVKYLTITNPIGTANVIYTTANGGIYTTNTKVRNELATIYLSIPVTNSIAKALEFKHTGGDDDWYIYTASTEFCNTPPVAIDDIYTGTSNTPLNLSPLSGDSDADGHTLTITTINGITIASGTTQSIVVT